MRKLVFVTIIVMLSLAMGLPGSLAQDDDAPPELILAERPGFHPEGIEWDAEGERFLTGSITEGTIFEIADDGTVTPFIEDEQLVASIGIHIDGDRLLVANANTSQSLAQLGIYDLESGEEIAFVDLGELVEDQEQHFANDVTADEDGNAYVTDSFAPVIYKVTPEGEASIFLQDPAFSVEGFGLNGIDYHPDGYLIVALAGAGELYKIPVDAPEEFSEVELSEPLGGDGIILDDDLNLIMVAGTVVDGENRSEVVKVASEDDWASAEVIARTTAIPEASPTTATIRAGYVYVVHAHFAGIGAEQPVEAFEIMRVDLGDEMMDGMEEATPTPEAQPTTDPQATEEVSG